MRRTLFLAAAVGAARAAAPWTLNLLDASTGGLCLDGSPGGYYIQQGTSRRVVMHLQGGGWCTSLADCAARARFPVYPGQPSIGSSTNWTRVATCPDAGAPVCAADGGAGGLLSSNATINPLFDATKVFFAYCDGGSFAGRAADAVPVNSSVSVFFRGRAILDGVLDALLPRLAAAGVDEVLLAGCSAGGVAAFVHADYVAARVAAALPSAAFAVAPGAGFILDLPSFAGPYIYRPLAQWVYGAMNLSSSLNDDCEAAYGPGGEGWRCFIAPYVLPFIRTRRLFIANFLTDLAQQAVVLALGCDPTIPWPQRGGCDAAHIAALNGLRTAMIAAAAPVLDGDADRGAFLASCSYHVIEDDDGAFAGIEVGGQTLAATLGAWYTRSGGARAVVDGPWGSNPTCGRYTPPPPLLA